MTQQQIPYQPGQAPAQGYPPQYPQAPQPYGQPAQQSYQQPYAQPGYPQQQQPYQSPAPPPQPLAQGNLDDYYNQPTSGGGPSIAWSSNNGTVQKPLGTTYVGIVARDVGHGDVQQDTDPKTGQGKFFRDGRPRFVMKVPLKQVLGGPNPSQIGPVLQEFPEGEAQWFVRGQARDELTRAGNAVGLTGNWAPKEGDVVSITLVERRPSRGGGMPANVVQVTYQPGPRHQVGAGPAQGVAAGSETGAPSPAPVPPSPQQAAGPIQQPAASAAAPTYAQQQYQAYTQPGQATPPPQSVDQQVAQQGPPPQWAQPTQPAAPAQQPPQQLAPPAGLDPGQQELLARLQAQQQQQG